MFSRDGPLTCAIGNTLERIRAQVREEFKPQSIR
jgi:hypothetical protein